MKKKIDGPLKTELHDGDSYVDQPVLKELPVFCGKEPMTGNVIAFYKRIPLRWMKPGPAGKLVPR